MNTRITAILVVLAATACEGRPETDSPTGPHTEFRDSGDVRIIENTGPPEGSRLDWRLGPEPLVSIGETDGEEPYLFTRVFGATVLSDGRIVIGDDGTKELRVFDQQGNHMETWGGRGEGPGEFGSSQLWGLAELPGDSLILWHFGFPQLTVFGPDGEFVRRFIPERARWNMMDRQSHLWPWTVTNDGSILAIQDLLYNDPAAAEVWDAAGELRGTLGTHPGQEVIRQGEAHPSNIAPVMFARNTFLQSWGDLVVIGTNRRFELRAYALDGSLARIVRLDRAPRPVTDAHVDAYIEQRLSSIPADRAERRAERRRDLREMAVAEHLPAFAAYRPDALDHLWVYEYEAAGEERPGTLFTIFDPDGRVLGFFEIPEGMVIHEIGADYILGKVRDELGVETVHLWSLQRA